MDKSVFTINLQGNDYQDLISNIKEIIPKESVKTSVRMRIGDSFDGGTSQLGAILEFLQNKDVCYTVAAIVAAWIRSKNNKKITIKTKDSTIEASNLNEKQLFEIFHSKGCSIYLLKEDKKPE